MRFGEHASARGWVTAQEVVAPAGDKANYWRDPGFEGVVQPDTSVVLTGAPALAQEGTNREGLKLLQVPAGASYAKTVGSLTYGKNYRFSVWKKVGTGAWRRETRITGSADLAAVNTLGNTVVTLPLAADAAQTVLYDQAELVEYTSGDALPESWIPENRLGRIDWFVTDHLGSTKLLVSQEGTMRYSGDDDPFGVNLRSFGDKDSHRYTGQILDEEQGVYYYGARYYLPEIGRFLSGDPEKQYSSIYIYCGNKAVVNIDSDGKKAKPGEYVSYSPGQGIGIPNDLMLGPGYSISIIRYALKESDFVQLMKDNIKGVDDSHLRSIKGFVVPLTDLPLVITPVKAVEDSDGKFVFKFQRINVDGSTTLIDKPEGYAKAVWAINDSKWVSPLIRSDENEHIAKMAEWMGVITNLLDTKTSNKSTTSASAAMTYADTLNNMVTDLLNDYLSDQQGLEMGHSIVGCLSLDNEVE